MKKKPKNPPVTQPTEFCDDCGRDIRFKEKKVLGRIRRFRVACPCQLRREEARKDETKEIWASQILQARGFTGSYSSMTLDRWEDNEIVEKAVYHYVEEGCTGSKKWLFLHGPCGVGKTHIAVAITLLLVYEKEWDPAIIRWAEFCSQIQESWHDRGIKTDWHLARDARILIIDDLDKRPPTPWAMGQLYELTDYRMICLKPTIFTANHSLRELEKQWKAKAEIADLGAAIISRIRGNLADDIEFEGEDYRRSCKV